MDEAFDGLQAALTSDWSGGVFCEVVRGGLLGVGSEVGMDDYISKPVDIDQLLSLLRIWLYEK